MISHFLCNTLYLYSQGQQRIKVFEQIITAESLQLHLKSLSILTAALFQHGKSSPRGPHKSWSIEVPCLAEVGDDALSNTGSSCQSARAPRKTLVKVESRRMIEWSRWRSKENNGDWVDWGYVEYVGKCQDISGVLTSDAIVSPDLTEGFTRGLGFKDISCWSQSWPIADTKLLPAGPAVNPKDSWRLSTCLWFRWIFTCQISKLYDAVQKKLAEWESVWPQLEALKLWHQSTFIGLNILLWWSNIHTLLLDQELKERHWWFCHKACRYVLYHQWCLQLEVLVFNSNCRQLCSSVHCYSTHHDNARYSKDI